MPEHGSDSFLLTFQLLLIRNVALDEHRPLRFKLLVQDRLALLPGLRVAVQQGYLSGDGGREVLSAGRTDRWTAPPPSRTQRTIATTHPRVPAGRGGERWRGGSAFCLGLTFAPLPSSAWTKALPMPCAPPVTRATLPLTCMVAALLPPAPRPPSRSNLVQSPARFPSSFSPSLLPSLLPSSSSCHRSCCGSFPPTPLSCDREPPRAAWAGGSRGGVGH